MVISLMVYEFVLATEFTEDSEERRKEIYESRCSLCPLWQKVPPKAVKFNIIGDRQKIVCVIKFFPFSPTCLASVSLFLIVCLVREFWFFEIRTCGKTEATVLMILCARRVRAEAKNFVLYGLYISFPNKQMLTELTVF